MAMANVNFRKLNNVKKLQYEQHNDERTHMHAYIFSMAYGVKNNEIPEVHLYTQPHANIHTHTYMQYTQREMGPT